MAPLAPLYEAIVGDWGGVHIGAHFTTSGATLDYDCASGTIDEQVIPGRDGRFGALGTHSPGHGGPVRIDERPVRLAARYAGRVEGDRMTLSATLDNGTPLGPFVLIRGGEARIMRCL